MMSIFAEKERHAGDVFIMTRRRSLSIDSQSINCAARASARRSYSGNASVISAAWHAPPADLDCFQDDGRTFHRLICQVYLATGGFC